MSRDPSRAQLSSRLAYQERVPAFLQKMKARVAGHPVDDDAPSYSQDDERGEWEESGDGRPAIPRRPAVPERPREGAWGSERAGKDGPSGAGDRDNEDEDGEEAPQIVVLKEGKHLSAEAVENEKRAAKGLPPLPKSQPSEATSQAPAAPAKSKPPKDNKPMNFSSSKKGSTVGVGATKKRKIIGVEDDDEKAPGEEKSKSSKKAKKDKKALLSFANDDG